MGLIQSVSDKLTICRVLNVPLADVHFRLYLIEHVSFFKTSRSNKLDISRLRKHWMLISKVSKKGRQDSNNVFSTCILEKKVWNWTCAQFFCQKRLSPFRKWVVICPCMHFFGKQDPIWSVPKHQFYLSTKTE